MAKGKYSGRRRRRREEKKDEEETSDNEWEEYQIGTEAPGYTGSTGCRSQRPQLNPHMLLS